MALFSATVFLVLTLQQFWSVTDAGIDFNIYLNSSDVRGEVDHFWRSTGFCPPLPHEDAAKFDLSPDMIQNLAYIGAIPFNGISQVRVHWLFELVKVDRMSTAGPVYDFSDLDQFVALMHENELHLGFELMGNPSNIYTDMENKTQVYWWRDLVAQTALRYVEKYGIDYVRGWNFETWNEPDCHDFDQLKMSVQGFLNYYDACSEGLKKVDKSLVFGGPGDGCSTLVEDSKEKSNKYGDALMNHTIRGTNFFTGEKGVRIDFISLHKKGDGIATRILELETEATAYMKIMYPELTDKPFYNDEADPLVGWSKPKEWRADVSYAGLVAKVVAQHQNILKARAKPVIKNYALLSNDNGFLSYYPNQFTQRTLLARFQMNQTDPHYVTFVRKPVYTVMTMLALLGDRQVHLESSKDTGQPLYNSSNFGALATLHEPAKGSNNSDSWQMALLVYGAADADFNETYALLNLEWIVDPPPGTTSLKLMTYVIYNGGANPYDVWVGLFNKTDFPTLAQFSSIRQQEEPSRFLMDVPISTRPVPIPPRFQLLPPDVVLLHLCAKPALPPEKVTGLRFLNVTQGQVMVIWSDSNIHTKCLSTYEVEYSPSSSTGPFTRVNKYNSTITLFMFETDSEKKVQGYYQVRAVDYWDQMGEYSETLRYS